MMGIAWVAERSHRSDGHRVDAGPQSRQRAHARPRSRRRWALRGCRATVTSARACVRARPRSRRRWASHGCRAAVTLAMECRRSRSEWPGGLIGELEGAQASKQHGAMVVEGDEELVAEVDEQGRGGALEDLVVLVAVSDRRVRGLQPEEHGANADLDRGELGELALEDERIAWDHRSRSRVSASMTRVTTSRSTSLRFLRAVSRSAAVARRSRSRMAPRVASCSNTMASEAKTSRVQPARSRRIRRYSVVSSGVSALTSRRWWMREYSERLRRSASRSRSSGSPTRMIDSRARLSQAYFKRMWRWSRVSW